MSQKNIPNVHDRFFRNAMSDLRVAREFFDYHLPTHISKAINLNTLKLCNGTHVEQELNLAITDILYSVEFEGEFGYLYLLTEHQSSPDLLMPFRIVKYQFSIMDDHIKRYGVKKLPIVYPLVFYHGEQTPYPYSLDLFELFEDPLGVMKEILFKPFRLIDVGQIPDKDLQKQVWRGLMELALKHAYAQDLLQHLPILVGLMQQVIHEENGTSYVETTLFYLARAAQISDNKAFLNTLETNLSSAQGEKVMGTLAEYLEARGAAKGKIEVLKTIVAKLIAQGESIEKISQITDLHPEEIIDIQSA